MNSLRRSHKAHTPNNTTFGLRIVDLTTRKKYIPHSIPPTPYRKIMGKGGCVPPTTGGGDVDGKGSSIDVTVLEKEREEKKRAEPKFYWADDEEPHRRR